MHKPTATNDLTINTLEASSVFQLVVISKSR